jgi:regulator of sigma E protease
VVLDPRVTRVENVSYPPQVALVKGAQQVGQVVGLTFYVPLLALRGQVPAEVARPVGPVGIYDVVSQATEVSVERGWWFPLLSTAALISAGLGIANLLPIPGLDGGRLLFVVIEAVRRKRVSPEREGMIHFVGIAFLLSMVLLISYFDVLAPIGRIDWGP